MKTHPKTHALLSLLFLTTVGVVTTAAAQEHAPSPSAAPVVAPVLPEDAPPADTAEAAPPAASAAPSLDIPAAEIVVPPAPTSVTVTGRVETAPRLEWNAAPAKGITASLSDESFAMNITGRFMLRGETVAPHGESAETNLMVRRARLKVTGYTFSKDIQYYMQIAFADRDFESGNISPLYDAYITLTQLRDLNVRLGQYILPHDRARVISSSAAQLVDRSPVVSALNIGRDVGMQLFSEDFLGLGHILGYQLGFFGGEGRNARAFEAGFMYTARLQIAPFGKFEDYKEADIEREDRPRLAIGLGAAYNQHAHRPLSNQGTAYDFATFDYLHLEADMLFKVAGFSLFTQVMYRNADKDSVTRDNMDGTTSTEFSNAGWGWFAQAGYMFTDQFEAAGRYSQLYSLKGTDPDFIADVAAENREVIGGLSWYAHGHNLKIQADYAYLFGDDAGEGTHEVRVQGQTTF